MRIEQLHKFPGQDWPRVAEAWSADLVLVFGAASQLGVADFEALRARYPGAILFGCSTAGEIVDVRVHDDTVSATAIGFTDTTIKLASQRIDSAVDSLTLGAELAARLPAAGLRHVLVLSDGLHVNGTDLVEGIRRGVPEGVVITGGLAGDGARFQRTMVIADAAPAERLVGAIGFYGDHIRIGHGCLGGWDPFGPDRLITRSRGNVLYELDGHSALALYRQYLGEHASGLPAAGLLFPLALRGAGDGDVSLVRTILSVDEEAQSLTFAGDIPEGSYARLMKANFDRLVEGAAGAARLAHEGVAAPELALLISCVGRKLVLKQRIEEEVESVRGVLGAHPVLTGFYSYGEISPYTPTARCELHNQTMTITTFDER